MKELVPIHNQNQDDHDSSGSGTQVITRPEAKTKTPSMYKVVLLNDDFTPMDFVVHILQKFFKKTAEEATQVMMQVHTQGAGVAGVYSFGMAETKAFQVNEYSKSQQHPLKCAVEKA